MITNEKIYDYDFAIIGAGIAGVIAFYNLTKEGCSCIIIDKKDRSIPYLLCKLVCEHDFPFMPEIPKNNVDIFVRDHWTSIYASRNIEALVDGKEFGAPLGKLADEYQLIQWYLNKGIEYGGTIQWKHEVTGIKILKENAQLTLLSEKKTDIEAEVKKINVKAVILATGASGIQLQQDLGFQTPTILNSITATFKNDPSLIMKNIPADYIFRLHPQISLEGMLWLNRAIDYFNIGYVSSEEPKEMGIKFLRILQNYQPIQQYFKGLEKKIETLTVKDFHYKKCTKYPIDAKVSDRVVVIGDAAGLLYPLYLEGVIGAAASAKIASEVLLELNKNESSFTTQDLRKNEKLLSTRILNSYFKMGKISDEMFFRGNEKPPFTIWDAYLNSINELQQLRKNIWIAYRCQDLENYPEENDLWCGEQIYKHLPLSKKVSLMPFFLKFKFIS
ncbi:FAD-dependent oxidoreductase [Promethearchaeum syntrophicum]|uniref:FAD-dependent oxidoreductase n=1 Tax=Promethearchaeum syntrophicum TaxID=2594042 RepID=A0A5B9DBV8_9ARCH|nr:NAD(P)/FAD-dependent oxidoreductase [Candidatus Prometheoarchaeum syntrophicum]QEE16678.1 putative oxidoreductase [Candidatus Prometheoarchaeum syntrophicum]